MIITPSLGCKNSPKNQLVEELTTLILTQRITESFEFINHHQLDLNQIKTIIFEATISHGAHGSCLGTIDLIPFSMHIEFVKPSKLILKRAQLFIG